MYGWLCKQIFGRYDNPRVLSHYLLNEDKTKPTNLLQLRWTMKNKNITISVYATHESVNTFVAMVCNYSSFVAVKITVICGDQARLSDCVLSEICWRWPPPTLRYPHWAPVTTPRTILLMARRKRERSTVDCYPHSMISLSIACDSFPTLERFSHLCFRCSYYEKSK